jgi:vitamin B12 transporter
MKTTYLFHVCLKSAVSAVLLLLVFYVPALAETQSKNLVVTADDIVRMKAVKLADVLNRLPGLKAGETSVAIHGNYKVKVFLDGRPINDPTSSHGGVRWDMIPLETVERIEILKGKGGLEYGDDTGGGVILVTTRKIDRFSGNIRTYGGSHDTFSTSVNGQFSRGRAGIGISGALFSTNGYKINNDKDQKRAGVKFEFAPDRESGIALAADHLEEEKGLSGTMDYPTPFSRQISSMDSVSLSGRSGTLKANTWYNESERHHTDVSRGLDNILQVRQAGVDLGHHFSFRNVGRISGGISAAWGEAAGTTLTRQEELSGSLFLACSRQIIPLPLTLTAGARANMYSVFENSLLPDLKVSWQNDRFQIAAGYNLSTNAPSFHQRYNRTSSTRPNPDLGMETSENYTLTLSSELRPDLSVGATFFYNRITDRITYVRTAGIGQYQNIGQASYRGVDLSLNWKAHPKTVVTASYTYLKALDDDTGLRLTAKPEHKARAEIVWTPLEHLSVITGIELTSQVYSSKDNTETIPGYVLYNLRAEYGFEKMGIFSEIKNLTDTDYYYVDSTSAPPLTWIAGINWSF